MPGPAVEVPEGLVRATTNREGSAGTAWLAELPAIIGGLLGRWGCDLDGAPMHGEVAIVLPVRRGETAAALKVSFPHPGNRSEPDALRSFGGHGAVRLLDADADSFALLMERAGPDTLESIGTAEEAIETAGHLARRLAVPAGPATPALADTAGGWESELDRQVALLPGVLSSAVIERTRSTIRLLGGDTTTTMLHGDLHFGNVLSAEREPWLAIDPKGWRGSAAYDAFTVVAGKREGLRDAPDLDRVFRDRIRRFADTAGVDAATALACVQARATSSYLYQRLQPGDWFELELLEFAVNLSD
ncbi:streptomycin 6-kinase/streptomycin 6-kinase [Curtobacterium sp. PhB130]|uniref:aminoglycoside phosphotransferase family protein n=1 Tax=Curtobacterium sp. PhB130 TaxID=2485178 RepID=UPI000FBB9967|nr:aminoglycoside phosphotransferase family protein [Curtobacterium sp. PhB130]ROS72298.1 streptomycin 6-kinase/streptomycin 6-kinase [Curtobacterium sp. PhB130]